MKIAKGLMAAAMLAVATTSGARVIEHIGDRYLINVNEMELNGEESLLDVLMMCPEVLSQDGHTTASPSLFGSYVVRINNININMDTEMFLKNTKAREVKQIKMCVNPGIMKGTGGMNKVIDLAFRKDEKGTHGKVALEGDTEASGEVFGRVTNQSGKAWIMSQVAGKMEYADNVHNTHEAANVNVDWNITSKDNLKMQAAQYYTRSRMDGSAGAYDRKVMGSISYTRSLAPNGAYANVKVAADYTTADKMASNACSRSTSPYGLAEFGFPFIHKNIYVTAGVEAGYSASTNVVADYTDRNMYEDVYAQVDWKCGKWGVMVGDRFRVYNYWLNRLNAAAAWEGSVTNNYVTATVYCNITPHNTLQGLFARRFYGPSNSDFIVGGSNPEKYYTSEIYQRPIYVSELRYTYQQKNFNLMALVKNEHQKLSKAAGSDNVLTTGVSAFAHAGMFRFTAGVDYCWERYNTNAAGAAYYNWVSCHVAPQVSLESGWRFTANAIYNSRRFNETYSSIYAQPNFYLDVAASKRFNRHWLVEAKWHDIVDTRTGSRGVSVGGTYSF